MKPLNGLSEHAALHEPTTDYESAREGHRLRWRWRKCPVSSGTYQLMLHAPACHPVVIGHVIHQYRGEWSYGLNIPKNYVYGIESSLAFAKSAVENALGIIR